MECSNCNGPLGHNKKFCSRSCSAKYSNKTRVLSPETKSKISDGLKKHFISNNSTVSPERLKQLQDGNKEWREKRQTELMTADFESLGLDRQRKRIISEQNGCCENCGLNEWMGQPMPLEIEHKDGNHQNNVRSNKIALCPNCHALTSTWRGRNKSGIKPNSITDEQLVQAFLETGNIRQALLSVGMAAKGNNYGRVKRALSLRNLK